MGVALVPHNRFRPFELSSFRAITVANPFGVLPTHAVPEVIPASCPGLSEQENAAKSGFPRLHHVCSRIAATHRQKGEQILRTPSISPILPGVHATIWRSFFVLPCTFC